MENLEKLVATNSGCRVLPMANSQGITGPGYNHHELRDAPELFLLGSLLLGSLLLLPLGVGCLFGLLPRLSLQLRQASKR